MEQSNGEILIKILTECALRNPCYYSDIIDFTHKFSEAGQAFQKLPLPIKKEIVARFSQVGVLKDFILSLIK